MKMIVSHFLKKNTLDFFIQKKRNTLPNYSSFEKKELKRKTVCKT